MPQEPETRPSRAELNERRRRRQELLAELLQEDLGELTPSELRLLARDLDRLARRQSRAPLVESDLLRGVLWGAGLTALALLLLPQARRAFRPLAVAAARCAMDLVDGVREAVSGAQEGLEDIVAEAQFQRLQAAVEAAGPAAAAGAAAGVAGGGSESPAGDPTPGAEEV